MNKLIKHGLIMSGIVFVLGGGTILLTAKYGVGVFALIFLIFVVLLGL